MAERRVPPLVVPPALGAPPALAAGFDAAAAAGDAAAPAAGEGAAPVFAAGAVVAAGAVGADWQAPSMVRTAPPPRSAAVRRNARRERAGDAGTVRIMYPRASL